MAGRVALGAVARGASVVGAASVVCLLVSGCGDVLPGFYTESGAASALVDDCVDFVQMGAFVGDEATAELWQDLGQDDVALRVHCAGLADTDPELLDDYAARKVRLERSLDRPDATTPADDLLDDSDTVVGCNTNYSGVCLPDDDDVDVDCRPGGEGRAGDGPWFVEKTVIVMGDDVFDLDDDGDGLGCEPL